LADRVRRTCNMCDEPATVLDTEYNEYYCDAHAHVYDVFEGPHQRIEGSNEPTSG
jgi:hypothetical protein